jgi:hypothetical protein
MNYNEISTNIATLLYKETPSLVEKLDFDNEQVFLEPLLFAYFNSKKDNLFSSGMLNEIMQGYFIEKEALVLNESLNNEGIAYVPNLGCFDEKGNKVNDILYVDAFEILKSNHPLLVKYFVEFYKGHILNANPNHNSLWKEHYLELEKAISSFKVRI